MICHLPQIGKCICSKFFIRYRFILYSRKNYVVLDEPHLRKRKSKILDKTKLCEKILSFVDVNGDVLEERSYNIKNKIYRRQSEKLR